MISDELILELQEIIKRKYGTDLSFIETARIANDLIAVFDVLAQIEFRENEGK